MSKVLEFLSRNVIVGKPARHDTVDRPAVFGITGTEAGGGEGNREMMGSDARSNCQVAT